MRAVAGQPATVRLQLATDGGEAATPDTTPTVTVTAGDGTTVLYTAQPGVAGAAQGAYTWMLPPQSKLDRLTATWSCTVGGVSYQVPVEVNVVRERLVSPFTLRQAYPAVLGQIPDGQLLSIVDQVEDAIEEVLGWPPVLSGARDTWDVLRGAFNDQIYTTGTLNGLPYGWGAGRMLIPGIKWPRLDPPGAVYAGTINGVALDPVNDIPYLTVINGALAWDDYRPWISGRYTIWCTHGEVSPPADLRWAAGKLCNFYGKTSTYPERAAQIQDEKATVLFSLPTPDRPFGIPDVDAVINRYRAQSVL